MKPQSKGSSRKQRHSHLSGADLKALRAALEAKRAELQRDVATDIYEGTHSEQFAEVRDLAERAERAEEEEEELLDLADQESTLLSEVNRALGKMDKGTYGLSEESGLPIPLERLRAVPWARFIAEEEAEIEQGRREKRQRTRARS
jgi:DnaK suppressor protein